MHPIEQLRHVARAGGVEAGVLAAEAAEALAALAREPRALVPACRRLLEFHPLAGPLWWLCAEVLAAADPAAAARSAAELLAGDPTADELAASLPGSAVLAAPCSGTLAEALGGRPDCSVRLVGGPLELRRALRTIGAGAAGAPATGYRPGEVDEAVDGATLVVVEPLAAGSPGALLDPVAHALSGAARRAGLPVWVVAGVGRVLAPALFEACRERSPGTGMLPAAELAVVVGPDGAGSPGEGLAAPGAPAPPELLHRPRS